MLVHSLALNVSGDAQPLDDSHSFIGMVKGRFETKPTTSIHNYCSKHLAGMTRTAMEQCIVRCLFFYMTSNK